MHERPERDNRGHKENKTCRKQQAVISVVRIQAAVCIVFVALLFVASHLVPGVYQWVCSGWKQLLREEDDAEPLLRFAQASLNALLLEADAASAPQNCSEKKYQLKQEHCRPLDQFYVSSDYGWRVHPVTGKRSFHNGVDLAAPEGTTICAVMSGMVLQTGSDASNGNFLVLRHNDGVETVYCHMQFVFARPGEVLRMGQQLGTVGQTGVATGPHLHMSLKHNGIRYDPAELLQEWVAE